MMLVKDDEIIDAANKQAEELGRLKGEVNGLKKELLAIELENVDASLEDVFLYVGEYDSKILRDAVNLLMQKHDGYCGLFSKKETGGYNFIVGSKSKDCNELAKKLREKYSASCGGSAKMIQGRVAESIPDLL